MTTMLEKLPNELVNKIFRYLTLNNILCAFYRLNKRFDNLILDNYKWKAKAITTNDYQILHDRDYSIERESLELIMVLENTQNFFPRKMSFDQFLSLQILVLHRIDCLPTLESILKQCAQLDYFNCLKIIEPFARNPKGHSLTWINHVWSLPKLTHFYLHDRRNVSNLPKQVGIISSTIEHIYLDISLDAIEVFDYVLQYTPSRKTFKLHHLSCACKTNFGFDLNAETFRSLNMDIRTSIKPFVRVLEKLPHLEVLILDMNCQYIEYNLGEIIERNVPTLKRIQLHMSFHFTSTVEKKKEVNKLLEAFQRPFWMNKKIYFQCLWYESRLEERGRCYTSPRMIPEFRNSESFRFASTCSERTMCTKYTDCVDTFRYYDEKSLLPNDACSFYSNISSVRQLDIDLPFHEDIFSDFVSPLRHVSILNVTMTYKSTYEQLKGLLDRLPRVTSLILQYLTDLPIRSDSFNFHHPTIRQLKLLHQPMDESDCIALYNSPLAKQCERLQIVLQDFRMTLQLIQEMPELRLLIFQKKTNKVEPKKSASTDTEMVEWLNANLSQLCSRIYCSGLSLEVKLTINQS